MQKDYLCKDCLENNNGWCKKLKKQGLKQITSCDHHNNRLKLEVPKNETDMTDLIEKCQKPIKKVPIEERLPKVKEFFKRKDGSSVDFEHHFKILQARALIEGHYEWHKWIKEIPYIKFPGNWDVKAIPPFGGAIVRYMIKHENPQSEGVSIYLDCYGELGAVNEPYWEIYPDIDGDVFRCGINDTDELLERLHIILDRFN